MMKKCNWIICILGVGVILSATAFAADRDESDLPWKKAYLNLGWFVADTNSSFRLGESNLGIGLTLDVEDFLGLDSTNSAFRIDGGWRFTKNKRHKLELGWFAFHRDSSGFIDKEIDIPPEFGGGTIGPGNTESKFDFDIIKFKYEYSFFLDDRLDLNLGVGLFVMPLEFGVKAAVGGVGTSDLIEDITAPLPVFGLGFDFAITPKWFIRQQLDLFYLEIGDFSGSVTAANVAFEYLPWKNVGFGLGLDAMDVSVEAKGSDFPGIDFNGKVEFEYLGAQLYLKVSF
jgi:hypothetical protein